MDMIELKSADVSGHDKKVKANFAEIIVRREAEKPYYEILYQDADDRKLHIGFGSFYLGYVLGWIKTEFDHPMACRIDDAFSVIQTENAEMRAELEKVKAERDAAINAANELDKTIGRAWGEEG